MQAERKRALHTYKKNKGMMFELFILYLAWSRLPGTPGPKYCMWYSVYQDWQTVVQWWPQLPLACQIAKSKLSKYSPTRLGWIPQNHVSLKHIPFPLPNSTLFRFKIYFVVEQNRKFALILLTVSHCSLTKKLDFTRTKAILERLHQNLMFIYV